jgi:hypothetical protein
LTVFCCPDCRVSLTFRSPERRTRAYVIPHSDDFAGCDVCGVRYCAKCSHENAAVCKRCGGRLHEGRSFEPIGVYRLPMGLEQLPDKTARLARAKEVYEQGLYGRLEYEWMLEVIEEVGDARAIGAADRERPLSNSKS